MLGSKIIFRTRDISSMENYADDFFIRKFGEYWVKIDNGPCLIILIISNLRQFIMNSVNIIILYYDGHNFNCTDTNHHKPSHTITGSADWLQTKTTKQIGAISRGVQGVVTPTNNCSPPGCEYYFSIVSGAWQSHSVAVWAMIRLEINPAGD